MASISRKKNIFGRRRDTPKRLWAGVLWGFVAVVAGLFLGAGFLFYKEMPKTVPAVDALEGSRGVVVFTGGQGRVQAGFEVLEKFRGAEHLLISGVNPNTTREEMLRHGNLEDANAKFPGQLELDYRGQTTFGNIAQTRTWAAKNNLERVVLVTSSYHVPRAQLLLKERMPELGVVVYPVFSEGVTWRVMAVEYLKYTAVRLNAALGGLFFGDGLE